MTDCTANGDNFPTASEDATGTLYVVSPLVQVDDRNLADDFESSIKVTLVEEDVYPVAKPVAKIGGVGYETLQAAIDAAVDGDTITTYGIGRYMLGGKKAAIANGKPRKVALTAVARHIAILLNYIAKYPDFKPAQDPKDIAKSSKPKRSRGRPRKTA